MADIDLYFPSVPTEPTICIPVTYVHNLTTNENAFLLGEIGVVVGIVASILFFLGWKYGAPWIVKKMGWS